MGASDSSDKNASPKLSWQKQSPSDAEDQKSASDSTSNEDASNLPTDENKLEWARKFLQVDEVRNASAEDKATFLEGKGLTKSQIRDLLKSPAQAQPSEPETDRPGASSNALQTSSQVATPPSQTGPPVITYPEFLMTPSQPAPLITARRLLTTLYLFGSASFLLYGTSKYLISPMIAALTSSRHSLAETAQTNLDKLNLLLQRAVSVDVTAPREHTVAGNDSLSESDEDPTEMFHRDIGVQTSLPVSRSTSRPQSPGPDTTKGALDAQVDTIRTIRTHIDRLREENGDGAAGGDSGGSGINKSMKDLQEYLDMITYPVQSFAYPVTVWQNGQPPRDDEKDVFAEARTQIRSVKGALLSARSFPGGMGRVR